MSSEANFEDSDTEFTEPPTEAEREAWGSEASLSVIAEEAIRRLEDLALLIYDVWPDVSNDYMKEAKELRSRLPEGEFPDSGTYPPDGGK